MRFPAGCSPGQHIAPFILPKPRLAPTVPPVVGRPRQFIASKVSLMIRIAKTNGVVRLPRAKNVLGGKLEVCSKSPMTGFFRDGCCNTGPEDVGSHTVCVVLTEEFLEFSKSAGNDLSTPNLQWGFPGLQPGNRWCLCAPRWQEALDAGYAPKVILAATHEGALAYCDLDDLKAHAVDK
jgi:uncharacterized protein (DUF2237 family)